MADIETILQLAIGAAGPNADRALWRRNVISAATDIAGMLNEHSLEWHAVKRVTDGDVKDSPTTVFLAVYDGYTYEETSKRLLVRLLDPATGLPDSRKGQESSMRTDRTDEVLGQVMKAKLDAIPKGTTCRIWKNLETFKDKHGDDAKFRVLAHIEPDLNKTSVQRPAAAPMAPPPAPPAASAAPAPADSSPLSAGAGSKAAAASNIPNPSIVAAMDRLSAGERVEVIRHFAQKDIPNIRDAALPDETQQEILQYIELLRGG